MGLIEMEKVRVFLESAGHSRKEALELQKELRDKLILRNSFNNLRTVAGVDLAQITDKNQLVCGIVVFSYPGLEVLEKVWTLADENFPYIPGLLAFREAPAIIKAYEKLTKKPDLLIIDGHGTAHPRGFGIACHVGVLLDTPAMGIGKKKLYGKYEDPPDVPGESSPLVSKDSTQIGSVLRTRKGVKPVFISAGHNIDLETSVKIAIECMGGYKVPEPTRQADIYVARLKKEVSLSAE